MRRLAYLVALRLDRLHLTLQAAFGWTTTPLSSSTLAKNVGIPDPTSEFGRPAHRCPQGRLCDIVRETGAKTIHHLYDFGDSWVT